LRALQNPKNFCLPKETLKIFEFCMIINYGTKQKHKIKSLFDQKLTSRNYDLAIKKEFFQNDQYV